MANENLTKTSQIARDAIVPAFPKSAFKTFVFGPYLTPDQILPVPDGDASEQDGLIEHARYLRYVTRVAITNAGFKADFGESQDVMDFWTAHLQSNETATAELHHAYRSCGAVVIFASSVGSFCEMGLFSAYGSIVRKMLVLVHEAHRNANSFFNNGILEMIEQSSGRKEFVDFSDHQKCLEIVMKFVTGKYTKTLRESLFVEEAERIRRELPHG